MVQDYGRRIVVDSPFEQTVAIATQALTDEGLDVVGRIDVRDYVERRLHHDFRRYVLLQALPARQTLDLLQRSLDAGTLLMVTVAVYELADGETAVIAGEPMAPLAASPGWEASAPGLRAIAEQESLKVARALSRLQRRTARVA